MPVKSFRKWWESELEREERTKARRREYMREYRRTHLRADWHKAPIEERRRYAREHARVKRGRGYLIELEAEATRRGMSLWEIKDQILRVVTEDNLFSALFD